MTTITGSFAFASVGASSPHPPLPWPAQRTAPPDASAPLARAPPPCTGDSLPHAPPPTRREAPLRQSVLSVSTALSARSLGVVVALSARHRLLLSRARLASSSTGNLLPHAPPPTRREAPLRQSVLSVSTALSAWSLGVVVALSARYRLLLSRARLASPSTRNPSPRAPPPTRRAAPLPQSVLSVSIALSAWSLSVVVALSARHYLLLSRARLASPSTRNSSPHAPPPTRQEALLHQSVLSVSTALSALSLSVVVALSARHRLLLSQARRAPPSTRNPLPRAPPPTQREAPLRQSVLSVSTALSARSLSVVVALSARHRLLLSQARLAPPCTWNPSSRAPPPTWRGAPLRQSVLSVSTALSAQSLSVVIALSARRRLLLSQARRAPPCTRNPLPRAPPPTIHCRALLL